MGDGKIKAGNEKKGKGRSNLIFDRGGSCIGDTN